MGNLVFDGGLNENTGSEVFDFCFCVVLLGFEAFLVVGVTCETELAKREAQSVSQTSEAPTGLIRGYTGGAYLITHYTTLLSYVCL